MKKWKFFTQHAASKLHLELRSSKAFDKVDHLNQKKKKIFHETKTQLRLTCKGSK